MVMYHRAEHEVRIYMGGGMEFVLLVVEAILAIKSSYIFFVTIIV
jgi:hypothetical protein